MKRKNNLYSEILDITLIQKVYNERVRRNTQNKYKLEKFEDYYVENIVNIKKIFLNKKFDFTNYNIFIIKEPKYRLIMSQNISDKLINHIISEYFLVNIFDKSLINENIATRKNKGTHYGIKLLKKYLNKIKNKDFYILKFDISKYFFNIDHEILKQIIRTKIKDKDVLRILDSVIDSTNATYINEKIRILKQNEINKIQNTNSKEKEYLIKTIQQLPEYKYGKGLPIGNMSSQTFAVIYLNELDHFIKEKLKIKYYIRYMDDSILLCENKEYLEYCLKEINRIVQKYKLELNNKTTIINIKQGFDFLGFRYYIKNNKVLMKVKNQTKKRFKKKLKKLNLLLEEHKIEEKHLIQVKNSYLGHLKYGNTNKLVSLEIKKYQKDYSNLGKKVRIIQNEIIYIYNVKKNCKLVKIK